MNYFKIINKGSTLQNTEPAYGHELSCLGFFPLVILSLKRKIFLPAFINVQAFYVHLPILDLNKKNMLMKQLVLNYYIMK